MASTPRLRESPPAGVATMEPLKREQEEALLRNAVLSGDDSAWKVLYERYFASVYGYVQRRTPQQSELTEDIVQECWLVAVRRMRHFSPHKGRFLSWLFGIAANLLRNEYRRSHRLATVVLDVTLANDIISATPDERTELAELVALTFAELPASYEAVLRSKYEQQLTVTQIAMRWGQTQKSIESLLSRARSHFRAEYGRLNR